jgi:hypothetical protein
MRIMLCAIQGRHNATVPHHLIRVIRRYRLCPAGMIGWKLPGPDHRRQETLASRPMIVTPGAPALPRHDQDHYVHAQ